MKERRILADDLKESGYKNNIYLNPLFDKKQKRDHEAYLILGIDENGGVIAETYSDKGEVIQSGVIIGDLEELLFHPRAPKSIANKVASHSEE